MSTRIIFTAIVILLLTAGVVYIVCSSKSKNNNTSKFEDSNTFFVGAEDAEMNAAIATARKALPQFWQIFEKPLNGETEFSLKVKITDKNGTEHLWVVDITRKDGRIFGHVGNDPSVIKCVKMGDRIEVPPQDISDWGYIKNGKMYGKYTARVIVKRLPPVEAAKYKEMLADQ